MDEVKNQGWRRCIWQIYKIRPRGGMPKIEGEKLGRSERSRSVDVSEDWPAWRTDQLYRRYKNVTCILVLIIDVYGLYYSTHGEALMCYRVIEPWADDGGCAGC